MWQEVIVYILLAIVLGLSIRYMWAKIKKPPKETPPSCAGCPLADACDKTKTQIIRVRNVTSSLRNRASPATQLVEQRK